MSGFPSYGLIVVLAFTVFSCGQSESVRNEKQASTQSSASEGAFCEEHGVLEAVCTKCNPSLIPVFQAKGDWCEQHQFPASFCPIHHPEMKGRPSADVTSTGAPADGTKVRFRTKEAATLAGIEVLPAVKRSGGARLEAAATLVYDATRYAEVNARASGVIVKLTADVGTVVKVGTPLATVESAAVGTERSRVRAADTRVQIAKLEYERGSSLLESGIASERDVLAAKLTLENAKADKSSARAGLRMIGTGGGKSSEYLVRSPLRGTITSRGATIGHMVDLQSVLFEVVDTSIMWVEIDIPENSLSLVRVGQSTTISVDAMPDRQWRGKLEYLAPSIDPRTRTAKARLSLDNSDGVLRANMYGQAHIELADAKPTVMVPKMAVQRAGGTALVFVRLTQDSFEARRVRIGRSEGTQVEILEGIESGEPVAVTGSFLLKTETLKGSIGAGCCDVE